MANDNISRIKAKLNVLDYAQNVLGLQVKKSGDRTYSLLGGHNPTCLVVYDEWWYDFKAGCGGDVIDLCAYAKHNGDKGAAIRELGGGDCHEWVEYTQNLCNEIQKWHEELRESDRHYLYRRNIKAETVERLKLGFDGKRLVIPYFKNGYIAYYITRSRTETTGLPQDLANDGKIDGKTVEIANPDGINQSDGNQNRSSDPKYKKQKLDGFNENIPWGLQTLDREKELVIAEGAFDAMSFEQEGYRVLSPMSGHFNKEALRQVVDICRDAGKVYIFFDSDDAGNGFTKKMSSVMFENHVPFMCGTTECKDISEYYCAGGNLDELVKSAGDGLKVFCDRMKDKDEFKEFVFKISRFTGKPEMAEIFDMVKDRFPTPWLRELRQQATSAPPDDMICKEVAKSHILKYFDALGFYEYGFGIWRRMGDSEIKNYIADAFGHFRSGPRVNSVFTLLKGDCVSTEMFDQQPIFNFRNGVLDLVTGELHEHSPAYMSTMQTDYDYDPNEWSDDWMDFIDKVCLGDEKKKNLLQEIAGYVLFRDNSLQKCFFLIGEGANGKSVYLDVLTAVFGSGNVSNVDISGLIEPFQRIRLMTSMMNICSETQSSVKGAEAVFKQVVVGDKINGCHKGKDFLEFRPRAKFISACNEYIRSRDVTAGFFRRICHVSFDAKFVDAPAGSNEFRADRNITEKLKKNLSGIFNWVLAGYKVLLDAKQFTETSDQQEITENFMLATNPVMAYINEGLPFAPGQYSNEQLYSHYSDWCKSAGHLPLSRTAFIQRFKSTAKQTRPDITTYRTSCERGFILP